MAECANDWVMVEERRKEFYSKAKNLGHDRKSILETLKVDGLREYEGSMGDALNALMAATEGGEKPKAEPEVVEGEVVSEKTAVSSVPEGRVVRLLGSESELRAMVERGKRFFRWTKDLSDDQVAAAMQYARAIGANPVNEIHAWWDKKHRQFQISEHYSYLVRKAREADPRWKYTVEEVPADEHADYGVDPKKGDTAVLVVCQTGHQIDEMLALMDRDVGFSVARNATCTKAVGIVYGYEKTDRDGKAIKPPTGWSWRTRAEVRALRQAVRQSIGTAGLLFMDAQDRLTDAGVAGGGEVVLDEDAVKMLAERAVEEFDGVPSEAPASNGDHHGEVRSPRPPAVVFAWLRRNGGWIEGEKDDWTDAKKEPDDQAQPPGDAMFERLLHLLRQAVYKMEGEQTETDLDEAMIALTKKVFGRAPNALTVHEVDATCRWLQGEPGSHSAGAVSLVEAARLLAS